MIGLRDFPQARPTITQADTRMKVVATQMTGRDLVSLARLWF
jgi:hypothetical protein